ncbi:hypothetical protein ASPWEDRAFT_90098, partial [Aspergillus wentii DTO 134E9]
RGPIARALLEHGAKILPTLHGRQTPLHKASVEGCVETTKVLLEYGVDINARDIEGRTALYIARSDGFAQVVRVLL